jgi:hypothetical protein
VLIQDASKAPDPTFVRSEGRRRTYRRLEEAEWVYLPHRGGGGAAAAADFFFSASIASIVEMKMMLG